MPGNGWDLTINVKPRLDAASKKQVVSELQKMFGTSNIVPKSLEKQFREALDKAFKGAKVQIPKQDLERFVSSFVKAMSQAASQIDTATKAAERALRSAQSTRPTTAGRPSPPARTDADFAGMRPTKATGVPDVATAHKKIREGISQTVKVEAESVSEELKKAASSSKGATKEAADKINAGVKETAQEITADFIKLFEKIRSTSRGSKADVSSIAMVPDLKALAAAHSRRGSAAGNKGVTSAAQVERAYSQFTNDQDASFKKLKSKIVQLSNVTSEGLDITSARVDSLISDIKSLTSNTSSHRVPVGSGEIRDMEKVTERFVRNALRNVTDSLDKQLGRALDGVIKAAQKREGESPENFAARFERAKKKLGDVARDFLETIEVIEGAGRFNINKERTTGPGGRRGPSLRVPESEAFAKLYENASARISRFPAAQEALKIANDFKGIESTSERIKRVFQTLFDKPVSSTEKLKKNMVAVAAAIRATSEKDLVNREELSATAAALENFIKQIERMQQAQKGVPGAGKVVVPNLDQALGKGATLRTVIKQLEEFQREFSKARKGASQPFSIPYTDALGNLRKLEGEMIKTGDTARQVRVRVNKEFRQLAPRDIMSQAFRRVAVWGLAAGIVYGGISAFRDATRVMLESETALVSLTKVMREADVDMEKFRANAQSFATKTAVEYGSSIKSIYEAMRVFGQQGLEMAQVEDLVAATATAANVSVLNQAEAAEALTAATRQFGLEASDSMRIVDAWNEVANRNAVTVKTLADATKKAGSAAKTVGIEYEQFLGLVTAIGTATRQPGKEIGTSLRFIFQRSLRPDTEKTLAKYGVATRDLSGNFKGFIPLLTDIADKWDSLTKSQKLAIGQALGGARQYNAFLALMNNYGLAVKATNDAINSNGSALDENQKIMQTAAKKMEQMKASLHSLYISFGNSLLPVLKDTVDGLRGFIDWVAKADPSTLKFVATLGLMTVALSKFSFQLDYVLSAGGAGGGFGGLGSLFAGSALTGGQLAAIPLQKQVKLGSTGLAAKGLGDFGKLSTDAKRQLTGVSGALVDINGKAIDTTKNFSKFGAVVRNYGVQVEGATTAAALGITSLNSPLAKIGAALLKFGKTPWLWLIEIVSWAPRAVAALGSVAGATIASGLASAKAWIANRGMVGSLAILAATAVGTSIVLSKLWKAFKGAPKEKTGKEIEQGLRPEIALQEKRLGQVKQQLTWLKKLSIESQKYNKTELGATKKRTDLSGGELQKKKDSVLINKLRLVEASKEAGAYLLKVNPGVISSIDEYGGAVVKTGANLRSMAEAAVAAQAQVVALSRIKVATGYAGDAVKQLDKVKDKLKEVRALSPSMEALAAVFGDLSAAGESYQGVVDDLNKEQRLLQANIKDTIEALKKFPKETPIESYVKALKSSNINKALQIDVDQLNLKDFKKYTGDVITAADKMNQLFLQKKSVKDVKLFGAYTAAALRARNVSSFTLKDIESGAKKFAVGDIITWEKGRGPFGLTQAVITINTEGKKVLEGIDEFGGKVKEEIDSVKGKLSGATIFDTSKLAEEAKTSIFSAVKNIAGAGAGTIKFPAELQLGTKFNFELKGLDRLQQVSKSTTDAIVDATQAQATYAKRTEEFVKGAKDASSSQVLKALVENLNEIARLSSLKTFLVSLSNEIINFASSVEKATYELKKASIADQVESELATIYGGISKATLELPKFASERSPEEKLARSNPELAATLKASSGAVNVIKKAVVDFRTLVGLDLPKMLSELPAKDRGKFIEESIKSRKEINEALKATGGNKGAAANVKATHGVKSAVEKMDEHLAGKFDELMGKGKQAAGITYAERKLKSEIFSLVTGAKKKEEKGAKKAPPKTVSEAETVLGGGLDRHISSIRSQYSDVLGNASKDVIKQVAEQLKERFGAIANYQATRARYGGIDVTNPEKTGRYGFDFLERDARWVNSFINWGWSKFKGPKKVFSDRQEQQKSALNYLDTAKKAIGGADVSLFEPLAKAILSERQSIVEKAKKGGKTLEDREINLLLADKVDAIIKEFLKSMSSAGERLLSPLLKQAAAQERMITSIGMASRELVSFSSAVKNSTNDLLNISKTASVFSGLEAPIAGAAKGIPQQQPSFGKLRGDLTAFERIVSGYSAPNKGKNVADLLGSLYDVLSKRENNEVTVTAIDEKALPRITGKPTSGIDTTAYFREFATDVSLLEQSRKSLVSTSKSLYQQALKSSNRIKELIDSAKTPEQKARLTEYERQLQQMRDRLVDGVASANRGMAPLVESLSKLAHLEQVKMSLEGITKELQKMSDLEFDTTSIDIALGKHPLSPTAGVYGQPAGLDKFQRQEQQIKQKLYAPGGVSAEEMASLQYQQKKLEYDKQEALIQYQQAKENQKLASEVSSAKRALGILWDAQYKGIEGLQPIMDTLKGELEDAGKVTSTFGGKREFQGVPSLYGLQDAIAKVQEKVETKRLTKQRDIVTGPLIDINKGIASTLEKIESNTKQFVKDATKETTGGSSPKDIFSSLEKTSNLITSFTKTIVEGLSMVAAAMRKGERTGGKDLSGFSLANESITRFGELFARNTTLMQGLTSPLKQITDIFNEITAKVSQINEDLRVPTFKKVSEKQLPPGNFASGGKITGPGGPKSDSVPAMLSNGEFVVNANATKKFGVSFLNSLNKGILPGFAEGGLVGSFYKDKDEEKKYFSLNSRMRSMMTLDGIKAMQEATRDKSLTETERQRKLDQIYSDQRYRKEVREEPKQIDNRLLGERLGSGAGYIKVGNQYLAYGAPSAVDSRYRSQKRLVKFKEAVSDFKNGGLKFETLRQLASGISVGHLDNGADNLLVRSILAGQKNPGDYKKNLKDIEKLSEDVKKAPTKEELIAQAKEKQKIESIKALSSFLRMRQGQADYKQTELVKAYSVYSSAKDDAAKRSAFRGLQITQQYDADEIARRRADMAVFAKLGSKTGETIGSLKDSKAVAEMQQYSPGVGGTYKGKPVLPYMGRKVRLVRWVDPKTGKVFAVDSGSVLEDGSLYDPAGRTEEGGYKFHGFKIPWEIYSRAQKNMLYYLKATGGTKPLNFGMGSGVGSIQGFKPDGTPVYSQDNAAAESILPENREEQADRFVGKNNTLSRFFWGMGKGVYEFGKGQYEFGKNLVSFQDPRNLANNGIKGEAQRFRKEILGSTINSMLLSPAHNLGFSKRGLKKLAPFAYWLSEGDDTLHRDTSSLTYGLGRFHRTLSPLGVQLSDELGLTSTSGEWKPTAVSLGESTGELAAQISLALLTEGVKGGPGSIVRSVDATFSAGQRFSNILGDIKRFGPEMHQGFKKWRAARAAAKEVGTIEPTSLVESPTQTIGEVKSPVGGAVGEASWLERKLIGAKETLEGPSRLKVGYKGAKYGALGVGTLATLFGGTFLSGALAGGPLGAVVALLVRRFGVGGLKRIIAFMERRRGAVGGVGGTAFNELGLNLSAKEAAAVADITEGIGGARSGLYYNKFNRPYFSAGDFGLTKGRSGFEYINKRPPRAAGFGEPGYRPPGEMALAEYAEKLRRFRMSASGTIGETTTERWSRNLPKSKFFQENPYLEYSVERAPKAKVTPFEDALGRVRARRGREHGFELVEAMQKAGFSKSEVDVYLGALRRGAPVDSLLRLVKQSGRVGGRPGFGSLSSAYKRGSIGAPNLVPRDVLPTEFTSVYGRRKAGIRYGGSAQKFSREEFKQLMLRIMLEEEERRRLMASGVPTAQLASGGFVSGPGGPKSDSIPAMLSSGEFVLSASATKSLGTGFLNSINKGKLPGFAEGGLVSSGIVSAESGLSNIATSLIKDFISALADAAKSQISGFSYLTSMFKPKELPTVSSSSTLSTEQLLAMRGKLEGRSTPTVTPLVAGTGMTQEELLARRGKMEGGPSGYQRTLYGAAYRRPASQQYTTTPLVPGTGMTKAELKSYEESGLSPTGQVAFRASEVYSKVAPFSGTGVKGGSVSSFTGAAIESSLLEAGRIRASVSQGLGSGEEMSPEASALSTVIENFNTTISQLATKTQDFFGKNKEPTGPGSGDELPYKPGDNLPKKESSTGAAGEPIDIDAMAKAIASAIKDSLGSSTIDISQDSFSALKTSIEESSTTFKDSLEKATFTALGDNIKTALTNTTINISPESIASIGKTITDASSSIGNAIKENSPQVLTEQGKPLTGLGAAVRPEVVEALEGKVDILMEKIDITKNEITTDLNERLSDLNDTVVSEVRKLYEPRFNQTDNSIQAVDHEVKGMQAILQSINSRINRV